MCIRMCFSDAWINRNKVCYYILVLFLFTVASIISYMLSTQRIIIKDDLKESLIENELKYFLEVLGVVEPKVKQETEIIVPEVWQYVYGRFSNGDAIHNRYFPNQTTNFIAGFKMTPYYNLMEFEINMESYWRFNGIQLWVYQNSYDECYNTTYNGSNIFDVDLLLKGSDSGYQIIDRQKTDCSISQWIIFNLESIYKLDLLQDKQKLYFAIASSKAQFAYLFNTNMNQCKKKYENNIAKWKLLQPTILLYVSIKGFNQTEENSDDNQERYRRNLNRAYRKGQCQMQNYRVTLDDLGWNDWILAPSEFDFNFCKGRCARFSWINITNHAIIQSMLNVLYPRVVPKLCCVPTRYEPLTMMYVNEQSNVLMKKFEQMVVKECGCA